MFHSLDRNAIQKVAIILRILHSASSAKILQKIEQIILTNQSGQAAAALRARPAAGRLPAAAGHRAAVVDVDVIVSVGDVR